jgi:excisionase family DNA binding protein
VTGELLTTRAVADQLGVVPETVLVWARQGKIPAFKLPSGALRFRPEELDRWLEERATPRRGVSSNPIGAAQAGRLSSVRSSNPEDEE